MEARRKSDPRIQETQARRNSEKQEMLAYREPASDIHPVVKLACGHAVRRKWLTETRSVWRAVRKGGTVKN